MRTLLNWPQVKRDRLRPQGTERGESSTVDFKMRDLATKLAASVVLSALLTQLSYAQPFPESESQKAAEARKKADEKATDEAYKSMMKNTPNTPNSNKKVDPWGALRAPSANPGKQM
jgi:hypothetical protein